jgi:hypothetical protein
MCYGSADLCNEYCFCSFTLGPLWGVQCNMECALNKDGSNSGQQCPWTSSGFGLKCTPLVPGATNAGGVKNMGRTECARGQCSGGSVGLFCILQSTSGGNYKLCGRGKSRRSDQLADSKRISLTSKDVY